ncbi:MAG: 16S rRNA (cytosine(967)-C(5))-methyltransferase RsmB [Gemmatimonadota bacterium]|nr:16S rRNA (cytosine(967)-C(5))-methyltransferase RsmB [Gemmatimonadota bacterium]
MKKKEKKRTRPIRPVRHSRASGTSGTRSLALEMLGRFDQPEIGWGKRLSAFPARDRSFIKHLVSGTLRNRGLIDFYLDHFLETGAGSLPPEVLDLLRLAVFQLRFCDRVPDFAAVNEAVDLAKGLYRGRYVPLVNGVLRRLLRESDRLVLPARGEDISYRMAVEHSHPRWLVRRYIERFGPADAEALLKANNVQAPLTLRSRSRELAGLLSGSGFETRPGTYVPEALVIEQGADPGTLPGYAKGLFYVQDEAQILVGYLAAGGGPASCVVDLCAAPGGKACLLADLAPPGTLVLAADLSPARLNVLRENLERLGLDRVRLAVTDALLPAFRGAGLVLCDVPCSGTGVFRRKPGLRWRLQPEDLESLSSRQRKIILAAGTCVAPGGVLVYSTCSIEPEENWQVIEWFLAQRSDFRLVPAQELGTIPAALVSGRGCLELFPHLHGVDGVFAARLELRKGV